MGTLKHLISLLQDYEQRQYLISLLHFLSRTIIPSETTTFDITNLANTPREVAGVAAFLQDLISCSQDLTTALIEMLIRDPAAIFGTSSFLLRATIAALQSSEDALETLVEKTLKRFSDRLYIKHTPVLQQEIAVRVLLISSGYLHRRLPMFVFTIARSSEHTHGMSNRLAASSSRARWLGMIVGMALSELIDKPESRMVFDNDQIRNDEAKWYLQLVYVDDKPGLPQDVRDILGEHEATEVTTMRPRLSDRKKIKQSDKREEPKTKGKQQATSKILHIVELDDGKEEEDLVPYAKPDSDPEDSEEDPTLIRRNKPRAPVYIRDLIVGLRDTENYDHHHVALSAAAQLIHRKATFGKEVIDHAEELASILMNLNDSFEIDNFEEMKQDALIAVLLAKPVSVARVISQSFFDGDYSIQQRITMLTALGLGARQLAGFKDKDKDTETEDVSVKSFASFPSKQLPPHLHKLYSSSQTNSLSRTAAVLEHTTLEPLALAAADKLTGPNALKVRTFSSRLDPSKQAAHKKKPIQNKLAAIVAENFFFPLTGRFQSYLRAYGNDSIYFSPYLLPTFLRTLAVILHASGPGTLTLPDMTREFWELLFSLRMTAVNEKEVATMEALLFAFLMLLEVNEDKERLAREFAKELVETQEWAKMVLERMQEASEGDEEGERVRMLAAGVVVRVGEVVERWHRLMLGDMVDARM
jgi:telomere length regulation protein